MQMWWMVWSVPLMVLGVVIAVVSVSWGSAIHEREEHKEAAGRAAYAVRVAKWGRPLLPAEAPFRVDCSLCGVDLYSASECGLAGRVRRHLWTIHGIQWSTSWGGAIDPVTRLEPALAG
jgi:hypothetical protein